MFKVSNLPALAGLGLAVLASPALAASTCADATDLAAFRTAAVQQQLMVAALTCHDVEAYNRFVLAYQPELQKSDADLKAYFVRRGSEAAYDTFKTKLANLSSLTDIANGPAYCSNASIAFDMALKSRQALSSFVADQRLMIAVPKETLCSEPKTADAPLQAAAARPPVLLAGGETKAKAPEAKPSEKREVAAAAPKPEQRPEPKPEMVASNQSVAGVPAHALPANPYPDEAPPAYARTAEEDDADLPLPPRPARPRAWQAQVQTEYQDDRDYYYYAARYATAPRWYRWVPPPPDNAEDYGDR